MTDQTAEKVSFEFERICTALDIDTDSKELAEEVLGLLLASSPSQVLSAQKAGPQTKGALIGVAVLLAVKTQNSPSRETGSSHSKNEPSLNTLIRVSFPDSGMYTAFIQVIRECQSFL